MKHFIIGTAGHVDHGKTSLIKALTGIDTDRLDEEKKRGITTDLGFAYLDLPHFQHVGIVDVPGHEKFIHNMLAGAGGVDLALLVVAADEGVMPQTREHLDILRLLDVHAGVIVITKTDMIEPEYVDLVEEEIHIGVRGSFLENAPVVRTSARTGEGLEVLRRVLDETLLTLREKNTRAPLRMPIDRAFTMKGYGTVVTGTLLEGRILEGKDYVLYPENLPVRVRGIQVHSEVVRDAEAGQRVAVNIPGIRKDEVHRGNVLAAANSLIPTRMLDVRLNILSSSRFPVKNNMRYRFFHGSSELTAKAVLVGMDAVEPGESCYAQLRFEESLVVRKEDRFILRMLSPQCTIGGGVVLDADAAKKKRNRPEVAEGMVVKERGSSKERLYQAVLEQNTRFLTLDELREKSGLDRQKAGNDSLALAKEGKIIPLAGGVYLSDLQEAKLRAYMMHFLSAYHEKEPLQEGMPLQAFRVSLLGNGREKDADALRLYWQEKKFIKCRENVISLFRFQVVRQNEDEIIIHDVMRRYTDAWLAPPAMETVQEDYRDSRQFQKVLAYLLRTGQLIQLDQRYMMEAQAYLEARRRLLQMGSSGQEIRLSAFRDTLGTSRKVALALLEAFDRQGFTRKEGDARFLMPGAASSAEEI